jgi:hypothetical protein
VSRGDDPSEGPEGEGQHRHPEHPGVDADVLDDPQPRRRLVRGDLGACRNVSLANPTTVRRVPNEYRRNRIPCRKAPKTMDSSMQSSITALASGCRAPRAVASVPRTSIRKTVPPRKLKCA